MTQRDGKVHPATRIHSFKFRMNQPRKKSTRLTMLKRILIILASIAVVLLITVLVLMQIARSTLSPEQLVRYLEERYNLRAEIQEVRTKLATLSPEATLKNVRLTVRDDFAKEQVPLEDRPALESAPINIKELKLQVKLFPLMKGRMEVEAFQVKDAQANLMVFPNGLNTVDVLFASPGTIFEPPPMDSFTVAADEGEGGREGMIAHLEDPGGPDQIELPADEPEVTPQDKGEQEDTSLESFVLKLAEGRFENVTISTTFAASAMQAILDIKSAHLSDVDIDGSQPADHNSFKFKSDLKARLTKSSLTGWAGDMAQADLRLDGNGVVFSGNSARLNPRVFAKVTIAPGATVDEKLLRETVATIFPDAEEYGLELPDQPIGATDQPLHTEIVLEDNGITLQKDAELIFPDYGLHLAEKSVYQWSPDQQDLTGQLVMKNQAADQLVDSISDNIKNRIKELDRAFIAETVRDTLVEKVEDKDQISLEFQVSLEDGEVVSYTSESIEPIIQKLLEQALVNALQNAFR